MRIEAIEPTSGSYGFLRPGEVMDMNDDKAKQLIELGIVKEFKGNVSKKDLRVAVDKQNPGIIGKPKKTNSSEEPSKAVDTDPFNATVEGSEVAPAADSEEEGQKELKQKMTTKELKTKE